MARLSFLVSVMAHALTCLIAWFALPERVPMHFSFDGAVDNWAGFLAAPAVYVVGFLGYAIYLVTVRYRTPRDVD